jgi:IS5 family transposase
VVNQETGEVICTAHGKGREHDFRIFKDSKLFLRKELKCLADKGYQGIQKQHTNSWIPHKKPRGGKLTSEAKKANQQLAILRVVVEHVNRRLKIFKILAERYRNRRKRFSLRFNLLVGVYNYELRLSHTESAS